MATKSLLFLVLPMICLIGESFGQDPISNRKDSLSNVSWESMASRNWYLFDSLFVTEDAYLISKAKAKQVYLINDSGDSAIFYVPTGRTLILNGAITKSLVIFINLDDCSKKWVKVVSPVFLRRKYGVSNPKGGIIIDCL